MSETDATLEIRGLTVKIGSRTVLLCLNTLELKQGQIYGIVGANGSGKTTLLNILSGYFPSEAIISGKLLINGEDVRPLCTSPDYARIVFQKHSIHLVPQEPLVIKGLTVLDNIFLGPSKYKWYTKPDKRLCEKLATETLASLGWKLDLSQYGKYCTPAERQKIAITRVLLKEPAPKFILFDEPTSHLGFDEIETFHSAVKSLTAKRIGVVLVSHRPEDIINSCDTICVLDEGKIISHITRSNGKKISLSEIFGYFPAITCITPNKPSNLPPLLTLSADYVIDESGRDVIKQFGPVNVFSGEVLGIVGQPSNGVSSLFNLLSGTLSASKFKASIVVNGCPIHNINPASIRKQISCGFISDNKMEHGLILDMTIQENLLLGRSDVGLWIWSKQAEKVAFSNSARLHLHHYKLTDPITCLSGGYQQRVVLARELTSRARVIVMHNPSQGLDVRTRDEMYDLIRNVAKQGTAIVLITSDSTEAKSLSDRQLVL